MARDWVGHRIPRRLPVWPTDDALARMVRHPSAFAPTAAEVLAPDPEPSLTLPALTDFGARDVVRRDGTVRALSLAARAFVAFADRLFALAPELREVRFVAVRHLLDELVRCPQLARLQGVNLGGNRIGRAGAELLAACPYLRSLRVLDLSNNSVTDAGLTALRAAPWANSVEEIRLAGNELTADGERAAEKHFGNRALLR